MWGKLPERVKRVRARGRDYFYFRMHRGSDGELLVRLPHVSLPQFDHEYRVAKARYDGLPPPEWKRPDRSVVYFIGGEVGAIKIGWAQRADLRLASLQTGSPIPLAILATAPGGRKLEREYHLRFAGYRLHGEWFERHPDILAEIDRLTAHSVQGGIG